MTDEASFVLMSNWRLDGDELNRLSKETNHKTRDQKRESMVTRFELLLSGVRLSSMSRPPNGGCLSSTLVRETAPLQRKHKSNLRFLGTIQASK